jgi:hypothetical protein
MVGYHVDYKFIVGYPDDVEFLGRLRQFFLPG